MILDTLVYKAKAELKGEINSKTITFGNFNNPLPTMDRSSRPRINNEGGDLKNITDKTGLKTQNVLPDNSRIHIILECTWNIF